MRIPETLESLLDHGVLEDVIRPLMSGKEAQVYLVVSGGEERVAKVYKEAQNRTFKNRAEYTDGRKVRNSRDQRAMEKRSRHGRAQDEAAWRSTEVDMIYKLRDAGVRVPTPYHFIDGVLIMELVKGADGHPAPRLGELVFSQAEAILVFEQLLAEVVRMLSTGVVHGDLSDFNVLMGTTGPVVIDFPQAVNAASNQSARKLLLRDVDNLYRFLERFVPARPSRAYAQEMWQLYERGELKPDTKLTGHYAADTKQADADAVFAVIDDAQFDERRRREARGLSMRGTTAPLRRDDMPGTQPAQRGRPGDRRPPARAPVPAGTGGGRGNPAGTGGGRGNPAGTGGGRGNPTGTGSRGNSAGRGNPGAAAPQGNRWQEPAAARPSQPPRPSGNVAERRPTGNPSPGNSAGDAAPRKRRRRRRTPTQGPR